MSTHFVETWLEGPQSTQFYCRTWVTPESVQRRANVVFLHGYADHIGRFEHVFPRWSQRGICVFAFDLRGFGRTAMDKGHKSRDSSYGKTSGVEQKEDIEWAMRHVRSENGGLPLFLMGHSMGGARVLDFITEHDSPPPSVSGLSGIVVTSAFLRLPKPPPALLRWVAHQALSYLPNLIIPTHPFIHPEQISRDPAVVKAYATDPFVRRIGTVRGLVDMIEDGQALTIIDRPKRWPNALPILFLHGTSDQVALYEAAETFYNNIDAKDKTFIIYPDAYHELHNEVDEVKDKMIEDCIQWVEKHLEQVESTTQARL